MLFLLSIILVTTSVFFLLRAATAKRLQVESTLARIPGYGYAKVPDKLRDHWHATLDAYLRTRESLKGIVLVMDARHPLTERDQGMLDWFAPTGKPIHI